MKKNKKTSGALKKLVKEIEHWAASGKTSRLDALKVRHPQNFAKAIGIYERRKRAS